MPDVHYIPDPKWECSLPPSSPAGKIMYSLKSVTIHFLSHICQPFSPSGWHEQGQIVRYDDIEHKKMTRLLFIPDNMTANADRVTKDGQYIEIEPYR